MRVVWAHWGRVYTMGYDDPRYDRKDNLEKWRRAARGGITLCQYYTDNFAEPWVMSPFTVAMEGDRRYFRQKGIDSVYMLMWPRGYLVEPQPERLPGRALLLRLLAQPLRPVARLCAALLRPGSRSIAGGLL